MSSSRAARSRPTDVGPAVAAHDDAPANAALFAATGLAVRGRLVAIDDDGVARVDWPGREGAPARAASLVQLDAREAGGLPRDVLLVITADDEPIVAGLLHARVVRTSPEAPPEPVAPPAALTTSDDGRSIALQAAERVELRCGDSALVMTADGQVVLRGTNLTSRATETHRIRGAAVLIN